MNTLEIYIAENGLSEIETVDKLWEAGLISDLTINAADVFDCEKAVEFLKGLKK